MTTSKGSTDPRGARPQTGNSLVAAKIVPTRQEQVTAWRKRMKWSALLLMLLGIAGLLGGSVLLGRTTTNGGFWIGAVGVLAIVVGAFCARLAAAGPLPKRFQGGTE